MINKKLIIGLGTGRCGTKSLATLLNAQENSNVTHEDPPVLPWEFDEKAAQDKLESLLKRDADFVGDVSFSYLNYIEWFKRNYDNCYFIYIYRDFNSFVKSWMNKFKHKGQYKDCDKIFPTPIDAMFGNNDVIYKYWLYYQYNAKRKLSNIKASTRMSIIHLNDKTILEYILYDIGYKNPKIIKVHENKY